MTTENDLKKYGNKQIYSWQDLKQWTLGHTPTATEDAICNVNNIDFLSSTENVSVRSLFLMGSTQIDISGSQFVLGHGNSIIDKTVAITDAELINHGDATVGGIIDIVIGNGGPSGTVNNAKDGTMTFVGDNQSLASIHNEGQLIYSGGTMGVVQNNGSMQFDDTTDITGAVAGTGSINADGDTTGALIFEGSVSAGQTVAMSSQDLTIQIEHEFHATVAGFDHSTASIILNKAGHGVANLTYVANQQGTGGTLEIDRGTQQYALNLLGTYTQAGFHDTLLSPNQGSGIVLTYNVPS